MEGAPQNSQNEGNAEKLRRLDFFRAQVSKIEDKFGTKVDENIAESIAILLAMDFSTSSSCGGHTGEDDRFAVPYIEFYTPPIEGWKESRRKRKEWKEQNEIQGKKFQPLLEKFNMNRKVLDDVRLYIDPMGRLGGFRLLNRGLSEEELKKPLTREFVSERITIYQGEFKEFTDFLKKQYFLKS